MANCSSGVAGRDPNRSGGAVSIGRLDSTTVTVGAFRGDASSCGSVVGESRFTRSGRRGSRVRTTNRAVAEVSKMTAAAAIGHHTAHAV
jgi:hypothetical protein